MQNDCDIKMDDVATDVDEDNKPLIVNGNETYDDNTCSMSYFKQCNINHYLSGQYMQPLAPSNTFLVSNKSNIQIQTNAAYTTTYTTQLPANRNQLTNNNLSIPQSSTSMPIPSLSNLNSNTIKKNNINHNNPIPNKAKENISTKHVDVNMINKSMNYNKQCVLIYDWDDTLLPSHYLHVTGLRPHSSKINQQESKIASNYDKNTILSQLKETEKSVYDLLSQSVKTVGGGNVVIITNAEKGWVQSSCSIFLPKVMNILKYCHIISARSTFEKDYPKSTLEWKRRAMKLILDLKLNINIDIDPISTFNNNNKEPIIFGDPLNHKDTDNIRDGFSIIDEMHIISFGDSLIERQAVFEVSKCIKSHKIVTKSVKFISHPTANQLIQELQTINQSLNTIIQTPHDLDYKVTILVNDMK